MITDLSKECKGGCGFDIECETCGQTTFFNRTYFRDFIVDAKAAGWQMLFGADGAWHHYCATCGLPKESDSEADIPKEPGSEGEFSELESEKD